MVASIGSSYASHGAGISDKSMTRLGADLSKYKNELANCRFCSSAKTSEGMQKIRELTDKVDEIQSRLEKISSVNSSNQTTPADNGAKPADAVATGTICSVIDERA